MSIHYEDFAPCAVACIGLGGKVWHAPECPNHSSGEPAPLPVSEPAGYWNAKGEGTANGSVIPSPISDLSQETIDGLRGEIERLTKELREARNTPCGVCGGKPLASGRPCICKGIGTEQAEMQGLREECFGLTIGQ